MFVRLRRLIILLALADFIGIHLALWAADVTRRLLPLGTNLGDATLTFLNPIIHLMVAIVFSSLAVPPGLTGWWQVNGRSDMPMHLNTHLDLYYIRNYSLWLDLKILWKTIGVVLQGKGAY